MILVMQQELLEKSPHLITINQIILEMFSWVHWKWCMSRPELRQNKTEVGAGFSFNLKREHVINTNCTSTKIMFNTDTERTEINNIQ